MNKNNHIYGGFVILVIGVLILLGKLGFISWAVLGAFWQLWPVLLIAAGINMIFNNHVAIRIMTLLGLIITIVVYGTFFPNGGGLTVTTSGVQVHHTEETERYVDKSFESNKDLTNGSLNLVIPVGTTEIKGTDKHLLTARYPENITKGDVSYSDDKSNAFFEYQPIDPENPVRSIMHKSLRYQYELDSNIPWNITLQGGVAHNEMDLSSVILKKLTVEMGAGNLELKLGKISGNASLTAESGTANMTIRIPKDMAFRVTVDGGIKNITINGKELDDKKGLYATPNFDQAEQRLDMNLSMGIGNVKIIQE